MRVIGAGRYVVRNSCRLMVLNWPQDARAVMWKKQEPPAEGELVRLAQLRPGAQTYLVLFFVRTIS